MAVSTGGDSMGGPQPMGESEQVVWKNAYRAQCRKKYLWWELMEGRTILWLEANSAGIWSSSVWGYCLERLGQKCSKFTQRACGKRCKVAKASGDGCIHYKTRHERLSHAFVLRSRLQMKHKSWFYYNSRTKTSLHCNKIWNKACFWFNKKIMIS